MQNKVKTTAKRHKLITKNQNNCKQTTEMQINYETRDNRKKTQTYYRDAKQPQRHEQLPQSDYRGMQKDTK